MNDSSLIDLAAKITLLFTFAFAVVALMRRGSAAQRSGVWLATFMAAFALPFLGSIEPQWTVPVQVVREQPVTVRASAVSVTSAMPTAAVEVRESWSWVDIAMAIYWAGVLGLVTRRALGHWQLWRLGRSASLADSTLQQLLRDRLGLRRHVRLLISDRVLVPMTWGTWRPVVLLPVEAALWSQAELVAALDHELAHVRHFDAVRRSLTSWVCIISWPHPLLWLASRAWRLEQERACDDAVVREGADAAAYAGQLVAAVRQMRGFAMAHALVMAMPSGLETRVRAVIDARTNRSAAAWASRCLTIVGALIATGMLTMCQTELAEAPFPWVSAGLKRTGAAVPITSDQVTLRTGLISVAAGSAALQLPPLKQALGRAPVILSAVDAQQLQRALSQNKGVDLMADPHVTTRWKEPAKVSLLSVVREPVEFGVDGKPTRTNETPVGYVLEFAATLNPARTDIRIALHAVKTDLEGYESAGKLHRLQADGGRWGSFKPAEMTALLEKLSPTPDHKARAQACFATREWKGRLDLRPGESALVPMPGTDLLGKAKSDTIWCLVTPEVVTASSEPTMKMEIDALKMTEDKKAGVFLFEGMAKAVLPDGTQMDADTLIHNAREGLLSAPSGFRVEKKGTVLTGAEGSSASIDLKTGKLSIRGAVKTTLAK